MSSDTEGAFNAFQYSFFTPEGGQIVLRANSATELHGHVDALLEAVDETDGPGLLTSIQQLKAAGMIKEAASKSSGGSSPATASSGDLPPWVLPEASKIAGRQVEAHEIKSGNYKNKPGKWYKLGDSWVNQPRG